MMEIRPAALSEFALLPAIEADADRAFESLDPPVRVADFPPPGTAEEFAEAFHILVAGRPPVAFVQLELVDGQAHVEQLAVSPEYARQGIGRALLSAAKAWAREAGYASMTLTTFQNIPFNAPFYESCGFTELEEEARGPELRALCGHEEELGLNELGPRISMKAILIHQE